MSVTEKDKLRQAVRSEYGRIAQSGSSCCAPSCCGSAPIDPAAVSLVLGYTPEDTSAVPEGANMGLGCGNPQVIAALKSGEIVLDLGSGGGFDCFLASQQVGESGRVIGIDMTPDMLSKARANAESGGYRNVEFRLGEIECLPVADNAVDVILSNCVINLSPDKSQVFAEAYRILKPGGRLAISDIVATAAIPEHVRHDMELYTGCIAGASLIADLEQMLADAGFQQIAIKTTEKSRSFIRDWAPGTAIADYVVSATIEAIKPAVVIKRTPINVL